MSSNENLELFIVQAEPRAPLGELLQFMIQAPSHREAWVIARATAKSGDGAVCRDPVTLELHPRPVTPGTHTVKRVLSAVPHKRGRPAKITVADLERIAEARDVKIGPRIQRVLNDLASH